MAPKHQAFFASLFFSRLADQILLFLVPLVIFQMTNSVAWSGAAFFLETLPRFLSFPICGALCDRVSSLKLLRISQLYRALACFSGMIAYVVFGGTIWLILFSAIGGVLTTQGLMAREVMLPQVFNQYRFEKVASYTQIADQLGTVLGPLLAATLLNWVSWEYVVLFTALLFLIADGMMMAWQKFAKPVFAEPDPTSTYWISPLLTAFDHIIRLKGLKEIVLLTAAVNLIIGITLATSAAMVTGIHGETETYFAILQAAGAVATIIILFATAYLSTSLNLLGGTAYLMIFLGGLVSGLASEANIYALGFLLIIGFDKMFNVFIRSMRMRLIPRQDLGKTTGLIVMLNNLSQPLAGLLVTIFAGICGVGNLIAVLSLFMGMLGILIGYLWLRQSLQEVTAE